MTKPILIPGGMSVDDRGTVRYVNDFKFSDVKRFYLVSNHRPGFVRAWHAHRNEGKYVLAVGGSAIVGAVQIDDWDHPGKDVEVHRYILSAEKPSILYVPPGYANGFKSLTQDTALMFFSTATMEEAAGDDIRYDACYWNIWNVGER